MYKKGLKFILIALLTICSIQPLSVYAMNVYITPDRYEAEVDQKITYTITVEDGEGVINIDGQEVDVDGKESATYTFERSYSVVGEYRFDVTANQETLDYVVVKIVEEGTLTEDATEEEKQTEARLSALTVKNAQGEDIRLGFQSSTTTYNLELTTEDTEITIEATAWDEQNAQVQGAGKKQLMPGQNKFEIIVTAQDGETKMTYTINVYVKEIPVTYLEYNGKEYGLMAEAKNISIPSGFKKTKTTINKENVEIFTNGNILLVYGIDENEQGAFYIYREDEGIISNYKPLLLGEEKIYLLDIPSDMQTRDGMTLTTVMLADKEVNAWTFNDEQLGDYVLLYIINAEGEEGFYVYDEVNGKLLEYPDSAPTTLKDFEKWLDKESKGLGAYILYGSIALVAVVVAGVIFWMVKTGKKEDDEDEVVEETTEGTKEFTFPKKEEKKVVKQVKVEEEDDDQWLTDQFYKTIMGDDDE